MNNPPTKTPPLVAGWPLVGNALDMFGHALAFMTRAYHQHGAVFRLNAGPLIRYTVIAGIQANQWTSSREADAALTSRDLFGAFGVEFGSQKFLVAMDGAEHRALRSAQQPGYSRSAFERALPRVLPVTALHLQHEWSDGALVTVIPAMQRLVTQQLGIALTGREPGPYLGDVRVVMDFLINAAVLKMWPLWALKLPLYTKAKARLMALGTEVLATHRAQPKPEADFDLIDHLLASAAEQQLTENDLLASTVGPYLAGIDTVASTAAFAVYALAAHPEAQAAVHAELDAKWDGQLATLTPSRVRELKVLTAALHETMRLYPVAPFMPRITTTPIEFGGYQIPVGTQLLVANAIPHLLAEFYPEPERFSLERGQQYRQRGAFTPFGLGAHTCLGAGTAEVQLLTTLALLFKRHRVTLPAGFKLSIGMKPLPAPSRLQVNVAKR